MTSQSTSACRFIGGPYDNRIIAIPDHTQTIETTTLDVDPDLRWIPELGGWLIADPDTGPASPNIAPPHHPLSAATRRHLRGRLRTPTSCTARPVPDLTHQGRCQ
jgi:hypothetical protein